MEERRGGFRYITVKGIKWLQEKNLIRIFVVWYENTCGDY